MTISEEFSKLTTAKHRIRKAISRKDTGLTTEHEFKVYPDYLEFGDVTYDSDGLLDYSEDGTSVFTIPSDVTAIRDYAFYDYTALKYLEIPSSSVIPLEGTHALTNTLVPTTGYICVPSSLLSSYKSATNWSNYSSRFVTPNYIANSSTWMSGNTGNNNSNSCTLTKTITTDSSLPISASVLKVAIKNSATSAKGSTGVYYGYAAQLGSGVTLTDKIKVGETYTYSFYAKADSSNTGTSSLAPGSVCESQSLVSNTIKTLTTSWQRFTVTFKQTQSTKMTCCFYVTVPASSTFTFYLAGLKLEPGTTAGDYVSYGETTTNLVEHEETCGTRTVSWMNELTIEELITDNRT